MANIVIGIEGLVGAGKTSICRELKKTIPNTIVFHGGNLYRAIVYAMMKNGNTLEELKQQGKNLDIKEMMDLFNIKIQIENNETVIYIENEKIDEDLIQSKDASVAVSTVGGKADNRKLFEFARKLIDKYKEKYNVIVSGRSLTVIYPELDYHFFVTASLEERTKRKCIQYQNKKEYEEIKESIMLRDKLQEEAGFYKLSSITKKIDVTECKTAIESAKKVLNHIKI